MAAGWLTVLKMVPWTDVIGNAPVVADGAKKLWNAVAKKASTHETDPSVTPGESEAPTDAPSMASLQLRLLTAEAAVDDLRQQMFASSELIKALAEQNTQLIKRVEGHRARLMWLTGFTALLAISVLATSIRSLVGL